MRRSRSLTGRVLSGRNLFPTGDFNEESLMNLHIAFRMALLALPLSIAAIGCGGNGQPGDGSSGDSGPAPVEMDEGPPDTVGGHPTEGPHHGSLIELGNEEYHAELVHDDEAGTVTIYILDSSAKRAVPIAAQEVTINLKHDGRPAQFKLAASPDAGDRQGTSSRFVSNDQDLAEHLDHADSGARLVASIAGKSYTGELHHSHDGHGGEGHAHEQ
jgi:hypothetical protein